MLVILDLYVFIGIIFSLIFDLYDCLLILLLNLFMLSIIFGYIDIILLPIYKYISPYSYEEVRPKKKKNPKKTPKESRYIKFRKSIIKFFRKR